MKNFYKTAFVLCSLLLSGCAFGTAWKIEESQLVENTSEDVSFSTWEQYSKINGENESEMSSSEIEVTSEEERVESTTEAETTVQESTSLEDTRESSENKTTVESNTTEPITEEEEMPDWIGELSLEQIAAINELSFQTPATGLTKLEEITYLTGTQVRAYIEAYVVPDCQFYNGAPITEEQKQNLLKLRNLEGIGSSAYVQYGVITENTAVRSFPVLDRMTKSTDANAFDYLQETMFKVGEGVVIIHQTADKSFSFVIGENYKGWVKTKSIGITTYPVFVDWMVGLENPLTVVVRCQVINGKYLRMGTKLPLVSLGEDTFTIQFPTTNNGQLEIVLIEVPNNGKSVAGYRAFTAVNLVDQADKLVGMPYGWGDTGANMDCSSTMNAIYASVGITLPRNSSAIPYTGTNVTNVSTMSADEKETVIKNTKPGTMLVMPGHVMMYVGQADGVMTIIHNVTTYSLDGTNIIEAYQCSKTPLEIYTADGTPYINKISYVIEF